MSRKLAMKKAMELLEKNSTQTRPATQMREQSLPDINSVWDVQKTPPKVKQRQSFRVVSDGSSKDMSTTMQTKSSSSLGRSGLPDMESVWDMPKKPVKKPNGLNEIPPKVKAQKENHEIMAWEMDGSSSIGSGSLIQRNQRTWFGRRNKGASKDTPIPTTVETSTVPDQFMSETFDTYAQPAVVPAPGSGEQVQGIGSGNKQESGNKTKAEATMDLIRETITTQEAREEELEDRYNKLIEQARAKFVAGKKDRAVRDMRKAKLIKHQQNNIAAAIDTMENQIMTIESALNNATVVAAMRAGSSTMKSLNADVSVEDIDKVMEEVQLGSDYLQEINDILCQPADNVVIDDDELLAELSGLATDDMEIDAPSTTFTSPSDPSIELVLPAAPQTLPVQKVGL